jgi:phytoene synthase|tara:strand:- start:9466 stop:10311 length:846 start_codon:yes stop_codon:yes gene_type:complete
MNKNLLQIHAKSFYWASFFLSKKIFYKCSVLYNFCRTLDDIVDSEKQLELKKKEFLNFKNDFLNKNLNNQIIKEMWDLINSQNISKIVILDLFDGVETDLKKSLIINSKKDLLVYSYRVAGTVGLMMSKILHVKNDEALLGAIDLGIAMQLTNIARDVVEDKKRNREYISHNFSSIKQTIIEAESFYNISFKAIKSIPVKSRFSVIVARRVYRKIGHYIIKKENIENYNKSGKIFVPIYGKIIESFLSIIDFFKLLFPQNKKYNNEKHELLGKEINLNERI